MPLRHLLQQPPPLLSRDGAFGFAHELVQAAAAADRRAGREVCRRQGRRRVVQDGVKAGRSLLDQQPFGGVQIVPHVGKVRRLRSEQLDSEVQRLRPVAPDEAPHDRTPLEAVAQMLPDAVKSHVGLPDVEDHRVIPKQV